MLGQSLSELTTIYSNTASPNRVDKRLDRSLCLEQQIISFGIAVRSSIHTPSLRDLLVNRAELAAKDELSNVALIEYFWLLFSQKEWKKIQVLAKRIASRLGELPLHVADLCFLSFYRLQRERLTQGSDREGFVSDATDILHFLAAGWPNAGDRHAAYRAMINHVTGDVERARNVLATTNGADLIEPLCGALSVLLPADYRGKGNVEATATITPAATAYATVISLDRAYFDKYARLVAERYAHTNPSNGLHFHCVGFDPRETFELWGLPINMGYTIDNADLTALSPRQKRGYFASSRYLYLARYLDIYNSVFVADVDGHVVQDISKFEEDYRGHDIVLSTKVLDRDRALNRLPWESVTANAVLARRTPAGRNFAEQIGAYVGRVMDNARRTDRPTWYADQASLFYTWWDGRREANFASFANHTFVQRGSWHLFKGDQERLEFLLRS